MYPFTRVLIRDYEIGVLFKEDSLVSLLPSGRHWIFNPLLKYRVDVLSSRVPEVVHGKLDLLVKSGLLKDKAVVVDLKDDERAIVWVDGRLHRVLTPGLYAFWTSLRDVRVEVLSADPVRFQHPKSATIVNSPQAKTVLEQHQVQSGCVGVVLKDGSIDEMLSPGRYAFWLGRANIRVVNVDLREAMLDIAGQELMTADKVTVRLNAVLTYRVTDPVKTVEAVGDVTQSLYREAQLALRTSVGAQELDEFLASKDEVADQVRQVLGQRGAELGVEVLGLGIRDVILPGEMKELLNRVTEAKKAAEANLIVRREETAAIRSQANTAKLLENNPTLMRLRELEVLEKVAANSKLNVLLGDKGLSDRVINLL